MLFDSMTLCTRTKHIRACTDLLQLALANKADLSAMVRLTTHVSGVTAQRQPALSTSSIVAYSYTVPVGSAIES